MTWGKGENGKGANVVNGIPILHTLDFFLKSSVKIFVNNTAFTYTALSEVIIV